MTIACTVEDLTQFNGGVVFAHIDIGKMPPQRVKDYLARMKNQLRPLCKYLEDNGFTVIFLPQRPDENIPRGTRWEIWGMNKPYDPAKYEPDLSLVSDIKSVVKGGNASLDVLSQAIEASSRRLRP
jgi:hypothetical protein